MGRILALLFATCVSMVGYTIHHSIWWSILDFFFSIFVVIKWLVFHEVTLAIIKQTFSFFL